MCGEREREFLCHFDSSEVTGNVMRWSNDFASIGFGGERHSGNKTVSQNLSFLLAVSLEISTKTKGEITTRLYLRQFYLMK